MLDGAPALLLRGSAVQWTPSGYRAVRSRPSTGSAVLITPPATVAALTAGYRTQIDRGAWQLVGGGQPKEIASGPSSATEA